MIPREFRRAVEKAVGKWVYLTTPLTSTAWDGDAYSTTAKTLIDLSAVFNVPAGVKAILAKLYARDSATWGTGGLYVSLHGDATNHSLVARPAGGDITSGDEGIVPCDANGDVYYQVNASGAGTMDVWIEIFGYWA